MADEELEDIFDVDGVEFGDQTINGKWRITRTATNIIVSVRIGGTFVDKLTITEAGLVTVNTGNLNASGAKFLGDIILNNAGQSKYKFGPIGTEHGIKYDGAGLLQLFTFLDDDYKICNGEDGPTVFAIDTSTKVVSLEKLKFPVVPVPIADENTVDAFIQTSWTPTLQDSTFSDAESQTYTAQWGRVQRFKDRIDFEGSLEMLSLGSLTPGDTAYIGGLLDTCENVAGAEGLVSTGKASALALDNAGEVMQGYVEINTKRIKLEKYDATGGTFPVTISEITASGKFSFKGSYYI
ncbi:hypothetical protein COB55_03200 [Candidatus Wolfebacteria bacterium]|nr:MAG: hypothetical protein COB55_03200 [Candidatus Wolfebacteria bacterium]